MPHPLSLIDLRRELHEHPEPAFRETKTHEIVERFVRQVIANDRRFRITPCLETGLVVSYQGAPSPDDPFTIFRTDMDALPLTEDGSHPAVSRTPGMMHACGHDIHMTILSGLIQEVARALPPRNFLFVFQPGEEGAGGAKRIIESGIFDRYPVAEAYALHVSDEYLIGEAATCAGVLFAMPREIDVVFTGKSGHAAFPQKGNDALLAAAHFVSTVSSTIAKRVNPMETFLCHLGHIEGGTARNIIADHCRIQGTLRALSPETMRTGAAAVEDAARAAAALTGCTYTVENLGEFLPVICDERLVKKFENLCETRGVRFVTAKTKLVGEDFGFFCERWPSLLFWLGSRREGEPVQGLHTPTFYPPDETIAFGLSLFKGLAGLAE